MQKRHQQMIRNGLLWNLLLSLPVIPSHKRSSRHWQEGNMMPGANNRRQEKERERKKEKGMHWLSAQVFTIDTTSSSSSHCYLYFAARLLLLLFAHTTSSSPSSSPGLAGGATKAKRRRKKSVLSTTAAVTFTPDEYFCRKTKCKDKARLGVTA